MIDDNLVPRGPRRSNLQGALITLILEMASVAILAVVGLGISALVLWLAG